MLQACLHETKRKINNKWETIRWEKFSLFFLCIFISESEVVCIISELVQIRKYNNKFFWSQLILFLFFLFSFLAKYFFFLQMPFRRRICWLTEKETWTAECRVLCIANFSCTNHKLGFPMVHWITWFFYGLSAILKL